MKTSPVARILAIVLILGSLGMAFLGWVRIPLIGYDVSFVDALKGAADSGFGSDSKNTLVLVLAGALALTALIGVICAAVGAAGGLVPYFIVSLGYLGGAIYLVSSANKAAYGFGVASMGVGAYTLPVLALIALLVMFVRDRR